MLGRLWLAACALAFAYGSIAPASAQPQRQTEPRIAFVVGNAGYQRGPLPQALNDAGLVAEALRSIGFEIVEGADLRQADILRSFRDFLDKVQAAGPDAIAFVYFSGHGLSFEGDNYLVGSDARLDREGDIAIEAVRLSDLMRSLGESPARAKVMVIDAARPSPFAPQGRGLAKGLAAIEPPQGMLVAFSAAPGTVSPGGQGPYGAFATAMAEMLRAPGLDLDGIFTRIRARTHETTQGAETPWYMSSLTEQIELVPPAAGGGAQAQPPAPLMRTPQPMRGISPEEAYALAIEMDTLNGYVEFVETYPRHPLSRRVYAIIRARREALAWMRARQIDTPPAYWTYLRRYPNGIYAFDAERRLRRLSASFQPPPGFGAMEFDVPPPIQGEPVEYVDAYEFREPPPRIMMAPPPAYIVDMPPPRRRSISPGIAALPLLIAPLAVLPLLAPAPRRGPPPSNANFTPGGSGGVGAPPGSGPGQRWGGRGQGAAPGQIAPSQVTPNQVAPNQVAPSAVAPNVVTPGVVSPAPGTTPGGARPPAGATLTPSPGQIPGAGQPQSPGGTGTPPPGVAGRPPGSPGFTPGGRPPQQPAPGTPTPSANVAPGATPNTVQPGSQPSAQPSAQPATQPPAGSRQPGTGRPQGGPPPGFAGRPPAGGPPPGAAPRQPGSPPPAAGSQPPSGAPAPAINRQGPPPGIARQTPPNVAPPANRPPPPPAVVNRPPPPAAPAARQAPPPQVVNRPPPAAAPPPPRPVAPPPPPPPRVAAPPPPPPPAARPPAPPPAAAKPPACPPGKTFKDGACK